MITEPHTYAEWAEVLKQFKEREFDEDTLAAMKAGRIEWQTGVAERFTKRLTDAANHRMNYASDRFQKDMANAAGSDGYIVQGLLALKKELSFIASALNLPTIPEPTRQELVRLVKAKAEEIQQNLEKSAQSDRSGKLSCLVNNHRVTIEEQSQ